MNDRDLEWEAVKTEHLVQDAYIDFRRMTYRLPDGTVFGPYYNYTRRNYVVIVAMTPEGDYLCVRQFRHGIRQVTCEFPAGGIETEGDYDYQMPAQPDVSVEDALDAAKRELQEETGYQSQEWQHLLTIPSNATMADNYGYLYLATNCRKVSGQHLDDTEFLNVELLSGEEIEKRIQNGEFQQAMHVLAYELSRKMLK
ncbi:MAG: NUDIX hydrolase [Lachnospiraceae bacterium]|nr:NUDIX hydrolase [Lachnospiraceae bacterium]